MGFLEREKREIKKEKERGRWSLDVVPEGWEFGALCDFRGFISRRNTDESERESDGAREGKFENKSWASSSLETSELAAMEGMLTRIGGFDDVGRRNPCLMAFSYHVTDNGAVEGLQRREMYGAARILCCPHCS